MKSLLMVALGLLLIGSVANAGEIISDIQTGPGTQVTWTHDRTTWSLTQNTDPTQLTAGTYTCGNVTLNYVTEGYALRRFYLNNDYGIVAPFTVNSVDWGVRRFVALLDSIPGPYSVAVELYSIANGADLLFANMTLIGSVNEAITTADNPVPPALGVAKTSDFTGLPGVSRTIDDPTGTDLVVAIHYPETYTMTPALRFAPSTNPLGETWPSYVAFAGCGFPDPVTPGSLGNSTPQLVLIVNGDELVPEPTGACCNSATGDCTVTTQALCTFNWLGADVPCNTTTCVPPVPTTETSWGQLKSIYR